MLSLRGVHVAYGPREVLKGVDLEVAAGEVVGLVGPNGSGKTTLLKAVTGVVSIRAGEVLLAGESASDLNARDRARRVAIVPQSPTLPMGFTALDAVVMGRTPHLGFFEHETAADHRRADEALATVGAGLLARRRVDELSGGEKQHVVIARALVQETPLLLLDEPTANLDIGHQMAIARLLRRLASQRGVAVLAALHDLTLASLYCDRLVLMAGGLVLATGSPAEVLTRENVQLAYGAETVVVRPEGLRGPVVLPVEDDTAD
jgi:iron complex transport system ATP-binding protein